MEQMTLQDGDILLLRIDKFSTWYRRLFAWCIRFVDGCYYHHAQIYFDGLLWEADTKFVSRPVNYNHGDQVLILRLKETINFKERQKMYYIINEFKGREYDYIGAILDQLIYILLFRRIWLGKRGLSANRKIYCTEAVTAIMNLLRGYFPEHYLTGPARLKNEAALYYNVVFEGTYNSNL